MNPRYWLVVGMLSLGCSKTPEAPQEEARQPDQPPAATAPGSPQLVIAPAPHEPHGAEVDKATVEAWGKRGFDYRSADESWGSVPMFQVRPKEFKPGALKDLPRVGVPFGIDLRSAPLTDDELARFSPPADLTYLGLSNTKVTDKALKHVASIPTLTRLDLSRTRITDAGLKYLTALPHLATINLWDTPGFTDVGVRALLSIPTLTLLDMSPGQITDGILAVLRVADRLHILGPAKAAGNQRPASAADVVDLDLEWSKVTAVGLKELVGLPNLARLRLYNAAKVGDDGLKELAACKRLVWLNAESTGASGTGLKSLATLPRLAELSMMQNPLSEEGIRAIAGLTYLTTLVLSYTSLTDTGLKELRPLTRLTTLRLIETKVTPAGLKELAAFEHLHTLDVKLTDETLTTLAAVDRLYAVSQAEGANGRPTRAGEVVSFHQGFGGGGPRTDAGLRALAGFKNLAVLHLPYTNITYEGVREIARFDQLRDLTAQLADDWLKELVPLKRLTSLNLVWSSVTDKGLQTLTKTHPQLTHLYINGTKVTDDGLKELAAFTHLTTLAIGGDDTLLTDGGLKHLANLPNLTELTLVGKKFTDAGVKDLGRLSKLKKLVLWRAPLADKGVRELQQLVPGLTVERR